MKHKLPRKIKKHFKKGLKDQKLGKEFLLNKQLENLIFTEEEKKAIFIKLRRHR